MPDDNLPLRRGERPLASFSAEQFANFLGGGELGRPQWADPDTQRKMEEQRLALRMAFEPIVQELEEALDRHSPDTAVSLRAHFNGALEGKVDSYRMFLAMIGELTKQGLAP